VDKSGPLSLAPHLTLQVTLTQSPGVSSQAVFTNFSIALAISSAGVDGLTRLTSLLPQFLHRFSLWW
jgi:hypothetical protein